MKLLSVCFLLLSTFTSFSLAVDFSADTSIDAAGIYKAAAASLESEKSIVDSYVASQGAPKNVHIQADWLKLQDISVYHVGILDMDVDCDEVYASGNDDGQKETDFGALDARVIPWYVLPNHFIKAHMDIKPNALGAIICSGKMYYTIFGDSNGHTLEMIGEGSLLLTQMCFPKDGFNGGKAGSLTIHLNIIFLSQVPSGVKKKTIDIGTLKALGDKQVWLLASALGSGSSNDGDKDEYNSDDDSSGSQVCCIFDKVNINSFL
ncbi:fungal chitosanase of glycosyl hydrolase group 75-domain-containing protein [Desarmillaria ectypa]|nr:fungal chitosanase of glycosyl hydrolase group 75-domain-containing protein [Desarmillaria ectypa]